MYVCVMSSPTEVTRNTQIYYLYTLSSHFVLLVTEISTEAVFVLPFLQYGIQTLGCYDMTSLCSKPHIVCSGFESDTKPAFKYRKHSMCLR